MQATILGSGTSVPSVSRASPGILIETEQTHILCDTGPGSLRQLAKTGTTLNDIDLIIYTHFHVDHVADLIPFIFACKYSPGAVRTRDITIAGPQGIETLYRALVDAYGRWVVPEHFTISWTEASGVPITCKDCSITTAAVTHTPDSIAVRFENALGKSIVYSGDSDYCDNLVQLAHNADLFILECAFPEHMKSEGHLIPSLAGRIARESQCKELVLTHMYPVCDQYDMLTPLQSEFSGKAVLAEDLMKLSV